MKKLALSALALVAALAGATAVVDASHQTDDNGCTSKATPGGTLTSPAFSVPPGAAPVLSFNGWWEIESQSLNADQMRIEYSADNGATWQAISANAEISDLENDPALESLPQGSAPNRGFSNRGFHTAPEWQSFTRPLPAGATGPSVRIRFNFQTLDELYQGFRGLTVDDVSVQEGQGPTASYLPFENFEGSATGWGFTGFWRHQADPQLIQVSNQIVPRLRELPSGDTGHLLADDSVDRKVAWFGEPTGPTAGTFCGSDALRDLSLAPNGDPKTTGEQVSFFAIAEGASGPLVWEASGANSAQGSTTLDGSGTGTFSYTGQQAGADTVFAFVDDAPTNGEFDQGEVSAEYLLTWEPAPTPTLFIGPDADPKTAGQTVTFGVLADNTGGPVVWRATGANAAQGTAPLDESGFGSFSYTGQTAGTDVVFAFADDDADGVHDAGEAGTSYSLTWQAAQQDEQPPQDPPPPPTIFISPATAEAVIGGSLTFSTAVHNGQGTVRYAVTGANTASGVVVDDRFSYTGQRPGDDTVTAFLDSNGNGGHDAGEPAATASAHWNNRSQLPDRFETADSISDLSDPEPFRETNIEPVGDGPVFVKLPGTSSSARISQTPGVDKGFIPLSSAAQLPVGTIIDADQGRAKIEAAANVSGSKTSTSDFYQGTFRIAQPRARVPVTEMVMTGGSFASCGRATRSSGDGQAAQRSRRVRRLWGNGKGRFRTRGRYSAATVRGTQWYVEDRCDGTLTRVRRGVVEVRDLGRRRTVTLRAPRTYFANARLSKR